MTVFEKQIKMYDWAIVVGLGAPSLFDSGVDRMVVFEQWSSIAQSLMRVKMVAAIVFQ